MIGTTLKDRYLIEEKLGEGAMGAVYRALDQRLGRTVAIKIISSQYSPDAAERFLREAHTISRLNNPHIMSIYDMDEVDKLPFLVVEFIPGRTLGAVIPDLPDTAKLDVARQIAEALAYAHAQGIIHRDLKSSNVMVLEGEQITVKLLDFGLALQLDASRLTRSGFVVGTASYMAPEQATGGPVDARADQYAFGVILYEMFTGSLPFSGTDLVAILYQAMHVDPQPPSWLRADLPTELDRLILDLLQKTPEGRPDDAEVIRRLQSIAFEGASQPLTAAPAAAGALASSVIGRVVRGVLVGRTAELTQIKGWIESAINGQCQLGLIAGPGGIGKSRLAEEALIYARLRGMQVITAQAYGEESSLPFQFVTNALRSAAAATPVTDSAVQRLLSGDVHEAGAMPEPLRHRVNDGIIQYIKLLAAETPLLFFMDDLHLADAASLSIILQLARSSAEQRILLLGTYADDMPAPAGLNELTLAQKLDRLGVRITLTPFSRRETGEQLQSMFGSDVSESFVERIFSETEGSPFYVEEIARWLVEAGIAARHGDRWDIESTESWQLPPHLQSFMQSLIERRIRKIVREQVLRKGGLDFVACIYHGKVFHEVHEDELRWQLSRLATRRSVKDQIEHYLKLAEDINVFVNSVNERLTDLKQGDLFRIVLDVTQGGVFYYYLGEDSYVVGTTTNQAMIEDNSADQDMRAMVEAIQNLMLQSGL